MLFLRLIAQCQKNFKLLYRHTQKGRYPHPEYGSCPALCNGKSNPGHVSYADGARKRGCKRAKGGDISRGWGRLSEQAEHLREFSQGTSSGFCGGIDAEQNQQRRGYHSESGTQLCQHNITSLSQCMRGRKILCVDFGRKICYDRNRGGIHEKICGPSVRFSFLFKISAFLCAIRCGVAVFGVLFLFGFFPERRAFGLSGGIPCVE